MTTDTSGHEMALAQAEAMIERQADEIARLRDENATLRAELDAVASTLPGSYYMDPPDGGSVTIAEQVGRMAKDAEKWREREAKIESLKARGFLGSPLRDAHDSDCATHNEPAYPNGPCDCSLAMQKGE